MKRNRKKKLTESKSAKVKTTMNQMNAEEEKKRKKKDKISREWRMGKIERRKD